MAFDYRRYGVQAGVDFAAAGYAARGSGNGEFDSEIGFAMRF